MALIRCPECGHEVSDKALACPNCGNPIATPVDSATEMTNRKVKEYFDKVQAKMSADYIERLKVWTVGVDIDIACPRCGKHHYTLDKKPEGGYSDTVLWCYTGRGTSNICMGRVCSCDKCKKWYPETSFGRRGSNYECKKCGTVQWDYTASKQEEDRQSAILNSVRRNMSNLW